MTTIVIAGGGTGGHVFPMIAVGDALRALSSDVQVVYVGTARGLEVQLMGRRGDDLRLLDILPLRGGGARGFARGTVAAMRVLPEARKLIRSLGASAVLSLGGYAGGPVALAARSLGLPIAILEPNSVLGLSNKLLIPLVDRSYINFPETARGLLPWTVRRLGVPLRRSMERAPYQPREGKVSLLVLGGSQGAAALNAAVPLAIACCRQAGLSLDVVHQTGKASEEKVRTLYAQHGQDERTLVTAFIDDVAAALKAADIVVARSGASTLAELCAVGRPSILVPYPHAADDHQMKNARSLERAGGAIVLPQQDASEERLTETITSLVMDAPRRVQMASAAASFGRPDAAARVAADLLALAHETAGRRASGSSTARDESPIPPSAGE
ncbi:undecaprenyldiphospho-muramoylpentapeptide beta-N-acetylglucosaminyltransferase [Chondromyces crocatus]|uniref:UDP-N-acetylglucosamine--N-acetylmuramyl-(pentapeptide) pyrophosphoryl-undecaprenol N-acetylglucosamine transferase n=1 Tax=Chondromyces crocatus TaxID=52 RepID=A0A0K1EN81_CHOCO|nr:undecaprenyldiphospho-muramoylpentapeptide beta-N-acetylglucosaminyltransferase [Chondromyces crocatus]AKT42314.1 UDP-diphospho-muramoylpentapeptide beta-N- acetylglucosaminyltransferase [Chondromyces crocatus]